MTHPMFDPDRRCLRPEEWPAPDRAAWEAACAAYDPLEPTAGLASRWADSSRRWIANGYGRWIGWLQRTDQLDPEAGPGERATRERVRAYLDMLEDGLAPYTIAGRLQSLGDALRVMEPGGDWGWIARAAARIHERARPVKDLNDRIRPPEEVLQLGLDLMHSAEHGYVRTPIDRAIMFRDGLALAALIHRPLRIGNFAAIRIGQHLTRCGDGWRLAFSPTEIKNKRPFQCAWPDELAEALERYLDVHRKVLLDGAEDTMSALWIAKGGAAMSSNVLGYRINKRTADEFGTAINPHSFRHIAATSIATDDPENVTSVPAVLGHTTLETSEAHYNRARMIDAGEVYQAGIERKRGRKRRAA